jgi:hypothetical protein
MKAVIARATLGTVLALGGTALALANDNCGINSNKPCPEKLNYKEPAYKSMNSNKPTAQRASDPAASMDVQAKESSETPTRATLGSAGVTAEDLKMPPKPDCGVNSPTPCANQEAAPARADVKATPSAPAPARGTLTGVTGEDLKVKPKPPTHEKEPAD